MDISSLIRTPNGCGPSMPLTFRWVPGEMPESVSNMETLMMWYSNSPVTPLLDKRFSPSGFLLRNGRADVVYYIRSCDLLRHFTDDVYMACRLLQWVVGKLTENEIDARASQLIMHISSLHVFRGDYQRLEQMILNYEEEPINYGTGI